MAVPPQKSTPTLRQYAWRQKGSCGIILKGECMLKAIHKMDVRGTSKWPLPGEEHPLIFLSTMKQKEVCPYGEVGG